MRAIPRDSVPIGPARARLLLLVGEYGHSHRSAAEHIGMDHRVIGRIIRGDLGWIKRRTAAKIMRTPLVKVRPCGQDRSSAASLVPSLGTVRRLRALAVMGHTAGKVAGRTGLNVYTVRSIMREAPRTVTLATREAVRDAYAELVGQFPSGGFADHVRFLAAARRWKGPMAWDDPDTDPEESPEYAPLVEYVRAHPGLGRAALAEAMTAEGMTGIDLRALLEQAVADGAVVIRAAGRGTRLWAGEEV